LYHVAATLLLRQKLPVAVKDGKIASLTDVDYDATSLKGEITADISPKADYILDGTS
jgi:hypothetical protein